MTSPPLSSPAGKCNSVRFGFIARISIFTLALLIAVAALHSAAGLRWLCDDAYITLRYVYNWLHGRGIVYNPGERVEGYTNFLWLVALGGAGRLGWDPVEAAQGLGLACYAGMLTLAVWGSARLAGRRTIAYPFTAAALALHYDFRLWMTGGLETALYTLLLLAGFLIFFEARWRFSIRLAVAGATLALVVLTRPDGALFFILANFFLLGRGSALGERPGRIAKGLCLLNIPFALILVPVLCWKYAYYGSLLPNTFWAKSGGGARWGQGFYYLLTYFAVYMSSALCLIGGGWGVVRFLFARRKGFAAGAVADRAEAARLFALTGVAAYLVLFVARVGGDFMYARFIVPMIPFIYWLGEASVVRAFRRVWWSAPALLLAVNALMLAEPALRTHMFPDDVNALLAKGEIPSRRGIVDEHWYYTAKIFRDRTMSMVEMQRKSGELLRPVFEGLGATVLLDAQNILYYYADFRRGIEFFGLTDPFIARQASGDRTGKRVGHEKTAPYAYMLHEGVDFLFLGQISIEKPYKKATFHLDGFPIPAIMITYDRTLVSQLVERLGERFEHTDFEAYLDQYIREQLPAKPLGELQSDYDDFKAYYFLHNYDPARQQPFLDRLKPAVAQ